MGYIELVSLVIGCMKYLVEPVANWLYIILDLWVHYITLQYIKLGLLLLLYKYIIIYSAEPMANWLSKSHM